MNGSRPPNALARCRAVLPITAPFFMMLLLGGCATFQNTPAQERVWAAEVICTTEVPGFRVTQALPDGSYRWLVDEAGKAGRAQECMQRELRRLRSEGK